VGLNQAVVATQPTLHDEYIGRKLTFKGKVKVVKEMNKMVELKVFINEKMGLKDHMLNQDLVWKKN
jgi:hypothetical protein